MKFSKLLLYLGAAFLIFWILGLLLKLASAIMQIALFVGLVLVIVSLLNNYYEDRKNK